MKCSNHPESEAVGTCVTCGKPLCTACSIMLNNHRNYCEACVNTASPGGTSRKSKILGNTAFRIVVIWCVVLVVVFVLLDIKDRRYYFEQKEESWESDRNVLQTAVNAFHTEYGYYPTNSGEGLDSPLIDEYPTAASDGIGDSCIVFSGSAGGNEKTGLVDVGNLQADTKSSSASGYGVAKNPGGDDSHYVWYVDSTGEVHSWYDVDSDGVVDEDEIDFVEGVYP